MPINYLELPIGAKYPYEVDCVVEIPKDTNVKYEYDEVQLTEEKNVCFSITSVGAQGGLPPNMPQ